MPKIGEFEHRGFQFEEYDTPRGKYVRWQHHVPINKHDQFTYFQFYDWIDLVGTCGGDIHETREWAADQVIDVHMKAIA